MNNEEGFYEMRDKTEFEEYQEFVDSTGLAGGFKFPVMYPAVGLMAEAGEVLEIVQKALRKGRMELTEEEKLKLIDEMGDVLWYLARLANDLEVSLDDVMIDNIVKLRERAALNG